jgi:hypothetical protein
MTISINLEIPADRYGEIEEYCINRAIGIPAYFLALHELNVLHEILPSQEKSERMKAFHNSLESLSCREKKSVSQEETFQQIKISEKERKSRKKS